MGYLEVNSMKFGAPLRFCLPWMSPFQTSQYWVLSHSSRTLFTCSDWFVPPEASLLVGKAQLFLFKCVCFSTFKEDCLPWVLGDFSLKQPKGKDWFQLTVSEDSLDSWLSCFRSKMRQTAMLLGACKGRGGCWSHGNWLAEKEMGPSQRQRSLPQACSQGPASFN